MNLIEIPTDQLLTPRSLPERERTGIADLAASIRAVGLLQPVIVSKLDTAKRYHVVSGHRRLAAAKRLQMASVPCLVRDDLAGDPNHALLVFVAENIQRVELGYLEEGAIYCQLVDAGMTQRQIAQQVGRNQSHICRRINLLRLSDEDQAALAAGELGPSAFSDGAGRRIHPELLAIYREAEATHETNASAAGQFVLDRIEDAIQAQREWAIDLSDRQRRQAAWTDYKGWRRRQSTVAFTTADGRREHATTLSTVEAYDDETGRFLGRESKDRFDMEWTELAQDDERVEILTGQLRTHADINARIWKLKKRFPAAGTGNEALAMAGLTRAEYLGERVAS